MAIIEVDNADVFYGDFKALDGTSCTIEGGAVGLLGPNGAGKSTLMKTLLGFNRVTRGTIRVFGLSMPENALEVRQQLGYMPEREAVSPGISGVSFLTYCGKLFGMSRVDAMERCHEVLNYVGLGESRYRKMDTYSTGMLQRMKLAQALIHDPKLLLLDEPTNGLDPESRAEVLDLIAEIAHGGKVTVLLSSHLLPDVQHVCDEVFIINGGKVVKQGSIGALTAIRGGQVELRVRDNTEAFVNALRRARFDCEDRGEGDLLVTEPEESPKGALYGIALDCHTQIRHYRPARHSLAEVFMEAVAKE